MSHYETIGVKKDATPAEIKRVFRAKAAASHPDKGGGHDEMAKLNLAYETLIDPARRLNYDATGEDEKPHDSQVTALIMGLFTNALQQEVPDVLKFCRETIKDGQQKIKVKQSELKTTKKKLLARRDKVTAKDVNLFHALIDNMIAQADQESAKLDAEAKVGSSVLKLLDDYSSTEKEERPQPRGLVDLMQGYGNTSTTGGRW